MELKGFCHPEYNPQECCVLLFLLSLIRYYYFPRLSLETSTTYTNTGTSKSSSSIRV